MLVYDSGQVQKLGDGLTPWTDREMNQAVKTYKEEHNLKTVKPAKKDQDILKVNMLIVECNLCKDNFSMYSRLQTPA